MVSNLHSFFVYTHLSNGKICVSDINSTPMNRAQRENDLSKADAILTIKTGETLIYTSVIITIVGLPPSLR